MFLKKFFLICVVQILEEFYNNFGPELKSVTGDPKRIDEVLCRVDNLVLPIEDISFNPFNICKMSSWRIIMQDFNTTVQVSLGHLKYRSCKNIRYCLSEQFHYREHVPPICECPFRADGYM